MSMEKYRSINQDSQDSIVNQTHAYYHSNLSVKPITQVQMKSLKFVLYSWWINAIHLCNVPAQNAICPIPYPPCIAYLLYIHWQVRHYWCTLPPNPGFNTKCAKASLLGVELAGLPFFGWDSTPAQLLTQRATTSQRSVLATPSPTLAHAVWVVSRRCTRLRIA